MRLKFTQDGYVKVRNRHSFLTYRQMMFANSLLWCFFNKSASARMAGYSAKSAKWQGYRLYHTLSVIIYVRWLRQRTNFTSTFPHATILLPDGAELKRRLAVFGIKVKYIDIMRATINAPSGFVTDAMNKSEKHLARLLTNDTNSDLKERHMKPMSMK